MAESGAGGRLLVRGLVAAGLVLAMLVLGVRTMVGRMSEHARQASATSSPEAEGTGRESTGREGTGRESTGRESTGRESTATTPGAVSPTITPGAPPTPGTATATPPSPPVRRGTMDAMAVRAVVRDALPEIRFCFEWQLNAHPDLAGRVTMQFTIQEDGSVANASVLEDALHDDTVTTCFTHVMSHLHFPPPEGGSVDVNYPFSLSGAPEAQRPEGI